MLGPSALAIELGISRQMVYQYRSEGKITPDASGKYDLDTVRRQLASNLGTKRGGVPRRGERQKLTAAPKSHMVAHHAPPATDEESGTEFNGKSKSDLEKAVLAEKLRKEKRENDVGEGKLVEVAKVNAYVAGMIIRAKTILASIQDELADRLAQEIDPVACKALLKREHNRALAELAEYRV